MSVNFIISKQNPEPLGSWDVKEILKRADASGNCIKHEFKDGKGYTK